MKTVNGARSPYVDCKKLRRKDDNVQKRSYARNTDVLYKLHWKHSVHSLKHAVTISKKETTHKQPQLNNRRRYINSDYNNVPHGAIIVVRKIQSQIQVNSQPREKLTRYLAGLYRRNECMSELLRTILLTPAFPSFLSHGLHDGLLARSLPASLRGWFQTVPCRALLCLSQTQPNPRQPTEPGRIHGHHGNAVTYWNHEEGPCNSSGARQWKKIIRRKKNLSMALTFISQYGNLIRIIPDSSRHWWCIHERPMEGVFLQVMKYRFP